MNPKQKPLDLSKVKIGQRVKLAIGTIANVEELDKSDKDLPCRIGPIWYDFCGKSCLNDRSFDIIAILPLPKKKVKAPKEQKETLLAVAGHLTFAQENLRRLIEIRDMHSTEINRLEKLIK